MLRDLGTSLVILVASSGVAIAANSLRKNPIPWIRKELSPAVVQPDPLSTTGPAASTQADQLGNVTIDAVLNHLSAGTATFIDAREIHEYKEGHLKGAMILPSSAIFQNSKAITDLVLPDAKVVVYCGGGNCEASHIVSDSLRRDFGFTDVSIYEKGWEEIEASGRFKEFIVTEAGR